MVPPTKGWRVTLAAVLGMTAVAACGGGSSSGGSGGGTVTIQFATQGLGNEGDASKKAVSAFEKANPNITVDILSLSSNSTDALQQLTQRFIAGGSTPDVATLDVTYPAQFAKSGWIAPLDHFNPDKGNFFPGQVAAGTYQGKLYAIPWFINAEGIYYRTDLVPQAPTSPQQLVQDAQQAMQRGTPTGLAFEGSKYEGVVTAFINFAGGFGGSLDLKHLDSSPNVQALTYMRDLIYQDKVSPASVTSWTEPDVEKAFMGGQAAFAMNWPYVYQEAEAAGSAMKGKTGWIPFPSSAGSSKAALGGDVLAINAKSQHQNEAWKFIQYLTRNDVQTDRALSAGDPPAVKSAYTSSLYSQAPYYQQEQKVFSVATSRPVDPKYLQISQVLQTQLNAALSNQLSPQAALTAAQQQVNGIVSGS